MAMNHNEREKLYFPMFLMAAAIVVLILLHYSYDLFYAFGLRGWFIDYLVFDMGEKLGLYKSQFHGKMLVVVILILCQIVKAGKPLRSSYFSVISGFVVSLLVFFFPLFDDTSFPQQGMFALTTFVGFIMVGVTIGFIGRLIRGLNGDKLNDGRETFLQCEEKIENEYSVNIPTKYFYRGRWRKGWINVVNPFRATIVLGTPGSGKSYSVYNPFIEQMIKKGYTMFCYDYKFPDLTTVVYNTFLENQEVYKKKYGVIPQFRVINFDDPRYSLRCNPLHPKYIEESVDASEIAEIIWNNVNPSSIENQDFFVLSAKAFVGTMILFLKLHQGGRYCTFPHLIELMGRSYRSTLKMMQHYPECVVQLAPFRDAIKDKAFEQLAGQIASAQIPLVRFASPSLYWVLSGNDFPLDVNEPTAPQILCVGNNPTRQIIYGTTMALYTSRLFRQINRKGKLPCGVLLDEMPTIFIKGLDNIIATARSNKVAVVAGAQDKSQLIRDYKDKEAAVIINTMGNIFSGQVKNETAKHLSESFGREFREHMSETTGGENDTFNRSFQQQEILPQSRIENLSQGFFFGTVADNNDEKIDRKQFCAEIQIDHKAFAARTKNWKRLPAQHEDIFHDDYIEQAVRENAEENCVKYLFDELMKEELEKTFNNPYYNAYSKEAGMEEAQRRYLEMDSASKKELLKKVIEKQQKENVNKIVQENYERIKCDIDDIFAFEKVSEDDEAEQESHGEKPKMNNQSAANDDETQRNPMFPFASETQEDDEEDS